MLCHGCFLSFVSLHALSAGHTIRTGHAPSKNGVVSNQGKNSKWAEFQYFAYGRYNWAGELKRAGISTQNEMKSGEGTVSEEVFHSISNK